MQFIKSKHIRIWALYGGFFLIFQSILSPIFYDRNFKTLPPNINRVVEVKKEIPGVIGKQVITTDSKGFRTTKDIDYEAKASYRIFAIGGSTTAQMILDDKNAWTHLLQDSLSQSKNLNVEVINTGVDGLRAKHHVATLQKIIDLHPDMVILLVGINDWNRHIKKSYLGGKQETKLEAYRTNLSLSNTMLGNLIWMNYDALLYKAENLFPQLRGNPEEYFSNKRNSLSRDDIYKFHPKTVSESYKKYLTKFSNTCHEEKIKCVFITQPTGYQNNATKEFRSGFWMTPPNASYTLDFENLVEIAFLYNSFLLRFAKENNHFACDAASALAPTIDSFHDDCHFNTMGAKEMSRVVGKCIEGFIGDKVSPISSENSSKYQTNF
ncbi:MAG: SGNH/GDSL hydrolase family protein [Nitrospinales bacterium]